MFINEKFTSILNAVVQHMCVCVCESWLASERKFVYHFCFNVQLGIITNDHNGLFIEKYQRDVQFNVASKWQCNRWLFNLKLIDCNSSLFYIIHDIERNMK